MPLTDEQRAEISAEPVQVEENPDGTLTIYGSAVAASLAAGPADEQPGGTYPDREPSGL